MHVHNSSNRIILKPKIYQNDKLSIEHENKWRELVFRFGTEFAFFFHFSFCVADDDYFGYRVHVCVQVH